MQADPKMAQNAQSDRHSVARVIAKCSQASTYTRAFQRRCRLLPEYYICDFARDPKLLRCTVEHAVQISAHVHLGRNTEDDSAICICSQMTALY